MPQGHNRTAATWTERKAAAAAGHVLNQRRGDGFAGATSTPGIGRLMPEAEIDQLRRENAYLKQRNAQLQADVTDVSAEVGRLQEALEHAHARRAANRPPSPLGGGR